MIRRSFEVVFDGSFEDDSAPRLDPICPQLALFLRFLFSYLFDFPRQQRWVVLIAWLNSALDLVFCTATGLQNIHAKAISGLRRFFLLPDTLVLRHGARQSSSLGR